MEGKSVVVCGFYIKIKTHTVDGEKIRKLVNLFVNVKLFIVFKMMKTNCGLISLYQTLDLKHFVDWKLCRCGV